MTALVGTTMLVAPSTAGASYISGTDGTCILTDDGYVYFRGHVGTHGDSLGPFEWVFEWRNLDRDGPWKAARKGFRYTVDSDANGLDWVYSFRSDPRPTADRAYRLVFDGGYGPYKLTHHNDSKENRNCVTRAG